jgi:soluble lytic murein transglycosylase-like protein
MGRLLSFLGLALLLHSFATGDGGIADYLKARRHFKITQAVGVETLETMVGTRIVEIQGRVKGTVSSSSANAILLERPDGGEIFVDCKTIPDWLFGNDIPARVLVRASRDSVYGILRAQLLGVAPEDDVARVDAAAERARLAAERQKRPRRPPHGSHRQWTLPASEVTPYYASFIKGRNPRLSDAEALRIAQGIVGFSLQYGVDARLIMAMVLVESGFNPNARSHAGAMGLGQLMPGTAQGMGVGNPYDSIENLYGTVRLVRGHLEKYRRQTGDDYSALVLALAAYNAGGGAVHRYGTVPPYRETQRYVRMVTTLYYKFCGR